LYVTTLVHCPAANKERRTISNDSLSPKDFDLCLQRVQYSSSSPASYSSMILR
jgi:hypothetical protein